jgi:hypothetical protein
MHYELASAIRPIRAPASAQLPIGWSGTTRHDPPPSGGQSRSPPFLDPHRRIPHGARPPHLIDRSWGRADGAEP